MSALTDAVHSVHSPPPLAGEGQGGGMQQDSCVQAHPLPNPPAEVGFIRLRPLKGDRTRVNPSSVASGGGSTPSMGKRAHRVRVSPPLIPAHSASKTRVNALMLGIQSYYAVQILGPRFRGDERRGVTPAIVDAN